MVAPVIGAIVSALMRQGAKQIGKAAVKYAAKNGAKAAASKAGKQAVLKTGRIVLARGSPDKMARLAKGFNSHLKGYAFPKGAPKDVQEGFNLSRNISSEFERRSGKVLRPLGSAAARMALDDSTYGRRHGARPPRASRPPVSRPVRQKGRNVKFANHNMNFSPDFGDTNIRVISKSSYKGPNIKFGNGPRYSAEGNRTYITNAPRYGASSRSYNWSNWKAKSKRRSK